MPSIERVRAAGIAVLSGAGLTGAALTVAGVHTPLTGALVFGFLLLAPAACVARLLPGIDPAARWIMAVAAALGILGGVAEALLELSDWSPRKGIVAVAVICAVIQVFSRLRIGMLGKAASFAGLRRPRRRAHGRHSEGTAAASGGGIPSGEPDGRPEVVLEPCPNISRSGAAGSRELKKR